MTEIDLVVPMVFPLDAVWQSDYARAFGQTASEARRNVRFRSWDTEHLLVQLCLKHMPWLRRIYILLAGESQVQPWMEEIRVKSEELRVKSEELGVKSGPSLCIVFHRDFIPQYLLPCFNVNTIEMFLHRIPGLSEHFIYSNDDFFPCSPLEPSDFFRPIHDSQSTIHNPSPQEIVTGESASSQIMLPCQQCRERPFPARPNIFHRFVKNGLDMVAADFGQEFTKTWLRPGHSMQPMLRSTVEHVCSAHADRIMRSFTLGRRPENYNQYIFPFWQHLSGRYINYTPSHTYLGPKTSTEDIVRHLRSEKPGIVCINDNEGIEDWQARAREVKREMERMVKSEK